MEESNLDEVFYIVWRLSAVRDQMEDGEVRQNLRRVEQQLFHWYVHSCNCKIAKVRYVSKP
jgi:hypothetical protein